MAKEREMLTYFTNFIKGIKSVFEKGKLRKCCFMCNRSMSAEDFKSSESNLENKIEMMRNSQRSQQGRVEQLEQQVAKLKDAKKELVRLQQIHDQLGVKTREKEALAKLLVESAQQSTTHLLKRATYRSASLKALQNEAIQLEDKRRALTKFYRLWRSSCEQVIGQSEDSRERVRFWERLAEMKREHQMSGGSVDFFQRYYGKQGSRPLGIRGELRMCLQVVLKLGLESAGLEADADLISRLKRQLQEQIELFMSDKNWEQVRDGLRSLHQKLEGELERAKTKVLEGVRKMDEKAREGLKTQNQIEVLQKEVGEVLTGDEIQNILEKREGLMEKTELELRTLLAEEEDALNQLRNDQKNAQERVREQTRGLDDQMCRVEDYKSRFERVHRNSRVVSNLRVKKGLEEVLRQTQADVETVRNRLRVRSLAADIERDEAEIRELVDGISRTVKMISRFKQIEKEKSEFQNEKSSLMGKKSMLLGKCRELVQTLTEVHRAEKNYARSLCRFDLAERNKHMHDQLALEIEKGTHEYHVSRIERINGYINRIWRHTYESKDIERVYIELTDSAKSRSVLKKSFNYRLMGRFFGGQVGELKGRCSAGQKMMVSIVIRLALAEAFCARCKMISLDEPTTNLDKVNATRLAEFLKGFLERDETEVRLTRTGFICC